MTTPTHLASDDPLSGSNGQFYLGRTLPSQRILSASNQPSDSNKMIGWLNI
ncbi:MAG: hypothetical protein ACON4H_08180 [Rubripirellula sp.]